MKKALLLLCFVLCAAPAFPEEKPQQPLPIIVEPAYRAFAPGEKLTYAISWSNFINAGMAVMEVKDGPEIYGKGSYHIVCSTRSTGFLNAFYTIRVNIESLVSAPDICSLSFSLRSRYGSKQRKRTVAFDHEKQTALYKPDDDPPETHSVPKHVLDSLSSLYYIRTRDAFVAGKPIQVAVFEKGKVWPLDVHMLGKERIEIPLGEFDTIKIRTHPLYEGVFPNKGAIDIWLTDDARKLPLLMKSKIVLGGVGFGAIVATLIKIETEKKEHGIKEKLQTAH